MRKSIIVLLFAVLFIAGCKKSDKATPAPNNTTTTTPSPYYFKFTMNGANYDFDANNPQYMTFYTYEAGGFEVDSGVVFPAIGISIDWHNKDTVKESDLLGLVGKTLYFSDTAITPQLIYEPPGSAPNWYSNDTANTAFNVKITGMSYVKNDTVLGTPIKVYLMTGTCTAVMTMDSASTLLSNGSFNFLVSRQNL